MSHSLNPKMIFLVGAGSKVKVNANKLLASPCNYPADQRADDVVYEDDNLCVTLGQLEYLIGLDELTIKRIDMDGDAWFHGADVIIPAFCLDLNPPECM